jgi:PTH1 family peptidyl-tRNA hydrolase
MVAGLGNPGAGYEATRHNAGAMALDLLAECMAATLKRHKSGCLVAEGVLAGERIVLARPLTYMNDSGLPLRAALRWYKTPPERLVVIHDELDIPFGQVRIKLGGGTAGHNGLSSVASHLGTNDFARVRIGISRPAGGRDPVDWVLDRFGGSERKELRSVLERAADAVESIVAEGPERAMNAFNTRRA